MRYINEKCPVCGEVFTENDEVVVCPECATPHHRECYNSLGSCKNAELHESGFVWQSEVKKEEEIHEEQKKEETETVICPGCGAEWSKKQLICRQCGTVLKKELEDEFQPPEHNSVFIDGKPCDNNDFIDSDKTVTVRDAACFIQHGKESYIKTFLDAKINNRRPKFNFFAFLFGAYWFFFRKIYKTGFVFAGAVFAIECFIMTFYMRMFNEAVSFVMQNANAFTTGKVANDMYEQFYSLIEKGISEHKTELYIILGLMLLMVVVHIFAGILANGIYLNHIKTTVKKIRSFVPNPRTYYTYLYAKGGTTILNTFIIAMAIYYISQFVTSLAMR